MKMSTRRPRKSERRTARRPSNKGTEKSGAGSPTFTVLLKPTSGPTMRSIRQARSKSTACRQKFFFTTSPQVPAVLVLS